MEDNNSYMRGMPKGFRLGFGIFMVIFYLAVGILFILDIFQIQRPGICIAMGIILIAYGIFRGIRLYKGWN